MQISEERHDEIAKAYRYAIFELILFTPEELEADHEIVKEQYNRWSGIAPVLFPAEYFTKRGSGELELNEVQNEIAYHLMQARKAAQKLGPGGIMGLYKKVLLEKAENDELSDSD